MVEPVIQIKNLGKLYYIGGQKPRPPRLRKRVKGVLTEARKEVRYIRHKGLRAYARLILTRLQTKNQSGLNPSIWATSPAMFWALQNVSFEVNQGEILGIIGRNGAGKSTLLKILSRITQPTVGQAVIHGRIGSLLEVGTGFHEELTGLENIYLNATILGMKRKEIDQRLDDIIAFSGVEKFIKTPVKYYSSGMKMRLAFSVAAYIEPEVMLIDEVLAVGDAAFQQKCLQRVEGLTSAGRTVLFVSHSMDSVRRFCNRVIWLESGRVVMDGPAREVTDAYLAEVTQIKSSKQWLIEGEILPSRQNGAGKDQVAPPTAEAELVDSAVSLGGTNSIAAAPSRLSPKTPTFEDVNSEPIPGSEYVRLVAVRVVNQEGQSVVSISADQPVGIEVSYDVLIQEKLLLPAFRFYSERGVHLFTAVYTDPEYMQRIKSVGRYRSTVWIPGHFLNIGTISVSTTITTPGPQLERHCVVENAVSFYVTEAPFGIEDAKGLYRQVPGAVRPKFTWETKAELPQLLLDPSESD